MFQMRTSYLRKTSALPQSKSTTRANSETLKIRPGIINRTLDELVEAEDSRPRPMPLASKRRPRREERVKTLVA